MRPSAQRWFPLPGNALPGTVRNSRLQRCSTLGLTSNARAASPMETPCSSRRTAASLNSFVNNLRDNPMTQFSFKWILSLNCLCQNWGQVQFHALALRRGNPFQAACEVIWDLNRHLVPRYHSLNTRGTFHRGEPPEEVSPGGAGQMFAPQAGWLSVLDRKSTRLNSSHLGIS